ncbi:MAG: 5-(carboxyamino)imidazole ribonucleotide mutase [Actinobacteria bacterium]|nr:5-(carboxyamino)imidazole ribonucleotide mutase [Actinomycetota bacterium]
MGDLVAIVMGSDSDWPIMAEATTILDACGISYYVNVLSAHRTPDEMLTFARGAVESGFKVIIAGAGGAAHLPGMIASVTTLPVIGVPIPLKYLDGMDSLLSIVQMPAGIPVATVGIANAKNAGYLAARIVGAFLPDVNTRVADLMEEARSQSLLKGKNLNLNQS